MDMILLNTITEGVCMDNLFEIYKKDLDAEVEHRVVFSINFCD